tara:strand:- start:1433 stop:2203 length:771 start_codon:yes stop_codon:yes gene_type:complete
MALFQDRVVSPDPFVWVKDKALPRGFCEECIEKFLVDENRYDGISGNQGKVQSIKKSKDLFISGCEGWDAQNEMFFKALHAGLSEYLDHIQSHYALKCYEDNEMYDWADFTPLFGDISDKGYQIQETKPTQFYDWHDDMMVHWNENKERTLTFIWYLNDIYDGGCTEFMNGFSVPPRAGRMVIFPSTWTYMHRGARLLGKDNKYICTGWVCRYTQDNPLPPEEPLEPETIEDTEDLDSLLEFEPAELTLDESILPT